MAVVGVALLLVTGCGSGSEAKDTTTTTASADGGSDTGGEMFPDVVKVELTKAGEGSYDVAVTLSSPYDSPERYADAWQVVDPEGHVLGVRELTHDHASEQPFTRNETVEIPDDVKMVTVQGRDQVSGYGGKKVTADVPS